MKQTIEILNATKKFKENLVLSDISFSCKSGEICGIVGRNGSGKTVLFKCICGFMYLDEGKIKVNGKEIGQDIKMLSNAGVLIEEPAFLRNKSGIKNLELLYIIKNKKNKIHLEEVMRKVGLDPKNKKHVSKYSLGMRQRLSIAQVIMEDFPIIILDEPMNGMDNQGVKEMRELFLELKKEGKTILVASHNKDDIDILCDHVYEIDRGNIMKIR